MNNTYEQNIFEKNIERFLFKKNINIRKYLDNSDFKIIKLLNIDIYDDLYTESDFNFFKLQIYEHYDFNALEKKENRTKYEEKNLSEYLSFENELNKAIQKGYIDKLPKSLNYTGVTKKKYKKLLKKIEKIEYDIYIDNMIYKNLR